LIIGGENRGISKEKEEKRKMHANGGEGGGQNVQN
jgi:hypothetical protein